jgi:hypothetical protein
MAYVISLAFVNLVTPKVGAKFELFSIFLFQGPWSVECMIHSIKKRLECRINLNLLLKIFL